MNEIDAMLGDAVRAARLGLPGLAAEASDLPAATDAELREVLRSIAALGSHPAPMPSAAVARLLAGSAMQSPARLVRRRRLVAGGVATAALVAAMSGVAAANDRLPGQQVVSGVIGSFTHPRPNGVPAGATSSPRTPAPRATAALVPGAGRGLNDSLEDPNTSHPIGSTSLARGGNWAEPLDPADPTGAAERDNAWSSVANGDESARTGDSQPVEPRTSYRQTSGVPSTPDPKETDSPERSAAPTQSPEPRSP